MKKVAFPGDIWLDPESVAALQPSVAIAGGTRVLLKSGHDLRIEQVPYLVAKVLNQAFDEEKNSSSQVISSPGHSAI